MSDYIKREDAIEKLEIHISMDLLDDIKDIPSADVAPVRHGHWIKITPSGVYECSKCGKYVMTCDIEEYKYCHRCGARMDGDNNAFI